MRESGEMYLETILVLHQKQNRVRAVDVAAEMDISKASVSIAIRQMKDQGLIRVEPDGNLLFTAPGQARCDVLGTRIRFFQRLLTNAGVEPAQALQDAISFSWEMSEASFEAFRHATFK